MSKVYESVAGLGVEDGTLLILRQDEEPRNPAVYEHATLVIVKFLHKNVPQAVWDRLPAAMEEFDREFCESKTLHNCTPGNVVLNLKDEYDVYNAGVERSKG